MPTKEICRQLSDVMGSIRQMGGEILKPVIAAEKPQNELVSSLDLAIDAYLEPALRHIADLPYISEETVGLLPHSDHEGLRDFWLVDPLDGTVNALLGLPYFSCSVSMVLNNQVQAASVLNIPTGDIYSACRGEGLLKNGQQVTASRRLMKSVFATGFAHDKRLHAIQLAVMQRVLPYVDDFRRLASPCLDLAYVAEGGLSGSFEYLKAWDFCAGTLFLDEIGLSHNYSSGFHLSDLNLQHWFVCGSPDMVRLIMIIYEQIRNDLC